ncbi:MAG: hypothetical protein ACREBJ_09845 [Nitrosotalea sp.]
MKTLFKKLSVLVATVALLVGVGVTPIFAQGNQSNQNMNETYRVNLSPLNNSGVHGFAMIHQTGDQYTVNMHAWGLEPNQTHVQHIHGMTDGSNGSCPTMAQNTDNDSTISLAEGLTTYGPILQPLTPFQMTGTNGMETYTQSFTVNSSDPTMDVMPLGNREIVIHGMTVAANADLSNPAAGYDATLPVACGHIIPMSGNGQGNGNGQGQNGSSVSISGNGFDSRNHVNVNSSNTSRVAQNNDTNVSNNVHSNANTGNNHSSFNTGGDTFSQSGSAMNTTSIFNGGGANMLNH